VTVGGGVGRVAGTVVGTGVGWGMLKTVCMGVGLSGSTDVGDGATGVEVEAGVWAGATGVGLPPQPATRAKDSARQSTKSPSFALKKIVRCNPGGIRLIQPVQRRRVVADYLDRFVFGDVVEVFGDLLAGEGEDALGVGVIGAPHQVVDVQ